MTMICHANNGQAPTDVSPIPGAIGNISNPSLADCLLRGWLEYVPSVMPNIKSSTWVDTGTKYVQSEVVQWTQEELDAQEAARQAEAAAAEAAQEAALLALESELDNAQLITKGLALTILDELNRTTQRLRAFDAAVQEATSLADLKTRVGSLIPIPDRTAAQLKAAVKAKVQAL